MRRFFFFPLPPAGGRRSPALSSLPRPVPVSLLPAFFLSLLLLAFLLGCSDDPKPKVFDYQRTASDVKLDTVSASTQALLCAQEANSFPGCAEAKLFQISWEAPFDTVKFAGYRLYLDTAEGDAANRGLTWEKMQRMREKAAALISWQRPRLKSTLYFTLTDTPQGAPTADSAGLGRIFRFDTTGRIDSLGTAGIAGPKQARFVFALLTEYQDGEKQGKPQFVTLITNDQFRPYAIRPAFTVRDTAITVQWTRPPDPTSAFNSDALQGLIKGYRVRVQGFPRTDTPRDTAKAFRPRLAYTVGGVDRSAAVLTENVSVVRPQGRIGIQYHFWLPDSNRISDVTTPGPSDAVALRIGGLRPLDTVSVVFYALDSNGQQSETSNYTFFLTDTTQPTLPLLQPLDSLRGRNSLSLSWQPSRDRVERDGRLEEAPAPDANIREYRLIRHRLSGRPDSLPLDTVTRIIRSGDTARIGRDTLNRVYREHFRFLPPNTAYRFRLFSIDSSGHESDTSTLVLRTDSVRLDTAGALSCRDHYVPIPGDSLILGSSRESLRDEPRRPASLRPYCIERREHRRADGSFEREVTWKEAFDACRREGAWLCTEAQWERACEGAGDSLRYGVMGELEDQGALLRQSCNHGTGDSLMAFESGLRNERCLSLEGVEDMAGNLSEWVLDRYDSAYAVFASSLRPDGSALAFADYAESLVDSGESAAHVYRGGSYLARPPSVDESAWQRLARCGNRNVPRVPRPDFQAACTSSTGPKPVLVYGPGRADHFCFDLPAGLAASDVADIFVRDTAQYGLLRKDGKRDFYKIPFPAGRDSVFRKRRPVQALLMDRGLVRVRFSFIADPTRSFEEVLEAKEFKDSLTTSQVLRREAGKGWRGEMVPGPLWGYFQAGSRPARANFSSRTLGFRCCYEP